MTNAEKGQRLMAMLRRNCFGTLQQRCRDEMALAAAKAQREKWQELDDLSGIRDPQYLVDQATQALKQSQEAEMVDKEILDWVIEKICRMLPEDLVGGE